MHTEIRILTADDHPPFQETLRQIVRGDPRLRIVAECGDGSDALARILEERPDVAVLDMEMPGLDGIAVAARLAAEGSATRAIILTMHKETTLLQLARRAGVWGYLLKENAALEVLAAIRAVAAGDRFAGRACSAFTEEVHS